MRVMLLGSGVIDPALEEDHAGQSVTQKEEEGMVQPATGETGLKYFFFSLSANLSLVFYYYKKSIIQKNSCV